MKKETSLDIARGSRWRIALVSIMIVWSLGITAVFDKKGYEIDALNARIRLVVRTGEADIRKFDANGLPLSYSARSREQYISPFYVVHYGLIYSNEIPDRDRRNGPEWLIDNSMRYWNVPPKSGKSEYFKSSADWIVSHIDSTHGCAHLIYDFNWPYHNYPRGGLEAPWWSGLTDGYAIILLLRAHDVYGDDRYLKAAGQLYKSVLTPISDGGSLNILNGQPWIEEYVDPMADPHKMSFVLNGMIYATYGVDAYEKYMAISSPKAHLLYASIAKNISVFDAGHWSEYDAIGNAANIKYHRVHVALLENIAKITKSVTVKNVQARWRRGSQNTGFYWIINSRVGVSQAQFILEYLALALFPWLFVLVGSAIRKKRRE